jgi:cell division protein FtsI/penicillin-binding protein 2
MRTTLVASLQQAAVTALGDDTGAVVMLDPRTGEVLVLASTPIYNASAIANPGLDGAFGPSADDVGGRSCPGRRRAVRAGLGARS